MYAVACDCNRTAMSTCCTVMHAQCHGLCICTRCVWREVYTWVYAWCKEHQYGLAGVCTFVYGQF